MDTNERYLEAEIAYPHPTEIPESAYKFCDYFGDGIDRLHEMWKDWGSYCVADIYTYALPLELIDYSQYGWSEDPLKIVTYYNVEDTCCICQLPKPTLHY